MNTITRREPEAKPVPEVTFKQMNFRDCICCTHVDSDEKEETCLVVKLQLYGKPLYLIVGTEVDEDFSLIDEESLLALKFVDLEFAEDVHIDLFYTGTTP